MKLLKLGNNDFDDDDSNNENSELRNAPKSEANCASSIITQFNDFSSIGGRTQKTLWVCVQSTINLLALSKTL